MRGFLEPTIASIWANLAAEPQPRPCPHGQTGVKTDGVETVAVCDLWSLARDHRAAQVKRAFNLDPQNYKYSEEMLAHKDIDGVMIATGDFQHAKLCTKVVRAGKDCYVEKPFANVLSEAIEARDSRTIRTNCADGHAASQPALSPGDARRDPFRAHRQNCPYRAGMECKRGAVAVHAGGYWAITRDMLMDSIWNGSNGSMAARRSCAKRIRIGSAGYWASPYRPFDPHVYLEFRLIQDFSSGIFDQWL